MNKFNARIKITYKGQSDDSDDFGNPMTGWSDRIETIPAQKEVIKGSLKEIANREQSILFMKWVVWSCAATRDILSTDRLIDLTSGNRVHEIITVYESDDKREVTILTKSIDNQRIYDAS